MTLRALRSSAGLTQEQLATKAGISQGLVSALEKGLVPSPGVETIARIAEALGCDLTAAVAALRASVAEANAA